MRISMATALSLVALAFAGGKGAAQLDGSWTLTVNGRSVRANADGTFLVSNIAAADQFGPAGPGSAPDFVSDEPVRLTGVSNVGGVTRYVYSEPFVFRSGETFVVDGLTFTTVPPPVPVSLDLSFSSVSLEVGKPVQASVIAALANGTELDVTRAGSWTLYRTSAPSIATIDENGTVVGLRAGSAFLTAQNEGAVAVRRIVVTDPRDPLTTVVGFVELGDGRRVSGAEVRIVGLPQVAVSDKTGAYRIPLVPTLGVPELNIRAEAKIKGEVFLGTEPGVRPNPGGLTDAGIIVLDETGGFGPMILSGMDPEDHGSGVGGAGWQMIQDVVRFAVEESVISANPSRVVQLGGSQSNAAILRSAVEPLGYTVTHMMSSDILGVDFLEFDTVYMPTSSADVSGGMTVQEVGFVNDRGADVIDYINSGGGLVAFSQNTPNGYQWFPLGGLFVSEPTGTGIELTTEGEFILSPSATAVLPFHNAFTGPPGFFGLDVLARESDGDRLPLIIGGIAFITTATADQKPELEHHSARRLRQPAHHAADRK